jgi:hypothetical protein
MIPANEKYLLIAVIVEAIILLLLTNERAKIKREIALLSLTNKQTKYEFEQNSTIYTKTCMVNLIKSDEFQSYSVNKKGPYEPDEEGAKILQ